ncbi:MAG: DUF5110 domain-containing protein, partial [Acidobacteriota bacterium]|nr:DUF5110 domain-containing protein [Acidobacteriota bacterium]
GLASTALYEDDGLSPAYKRGAFRRTTVNAKRVANGYLVSVGAPVGQFNPGARKFSFVIKPAPTNRIITVPDDGRARQIEIK